MTPTSPTLRDDVERLAQEALLHLRELKNDAPEHLERARLGSREGTKRAAAAVAAGSAVVASMLPKLATNKTLRRGVLLAAKRHPFVFGVVTAGTLGAWARRRRHHG
jgi:hypothetical protein